MTTQTETIEELLALAGAGDSAALERLVRLYEPRLRLAARSLLRPPLRNMLDSIDLVQSVHRALLPGLKQGRYTFENEDRLIGLAVTVLRHKLQRAARRKPMAGSAAKASEQPGEQADADDLYAHLVEGLDEIDRKLLDLRRQEFDAVEIAKKLGTTAPIIRARLSRLRKKLREAGHDVE